MNLSLIKHSRYLVVPFILSAMACSSSDSGLDSDKLLSELSREEAKQFCEWTVENADFSGIMKFTCFTLAQSQHGDDATMCEQMATACSDTAVPTPSCADAEAPDCSATVSEAEACTLAMADFFADAGSKLSCAEAPPVFNDSACDAYYEKCPEAAQSFSPNAAAGG